MDYNIIIGFISIFILELLLGADSLIFTNLLIKSSDFNNINTRLKTNIAFVIFKLLTLGIIWWLCFKCEFHATIVGVEVFLSVVVSIMGGLFLLTKAGFELQELIANSNKLHVFTPIRHKIDQIQEMVLKLALVAFITSLDAVFIAVSLTDNIAVPIVSIILSSLMLAIMPKRVFKFIYSFYKLRVISLVFVLLLGIKLIFSCFYYEIDNSQMISMLFFAIGCEFLNSKIGYRHKVKRKQRRNINNYS